MTTSGSGRAVAVASFLVLAAAAAGLFVPTFDARLAALGIDRVEATGATFALRGGEDPVLATAIALRNPTSRRVTVFAAELAAFAGGRRIAGGGTAAFAGAPTVPARGTATVRTALRIREGRVEAARAAVERGAVVVRGELRARVVRMDVRIGVEVGADG